MIKKSVAVVLSVVCLLVAVLFSFCVAVPAYYATRKRAVIVVPGLLNSALYNENTGKVIYDPLETDERGYLLDDMLYNGKMFSVAMDAVFNTDILDEVLAFIDGEQPNFLTPWHLDDDGNAMDGIVAVPFSHTGYCRYGALQATRVPYDYCENLYGSEKNTDVMIYEYDWRIDNRLAVDGLCEMAEGYDEVIIYAHSMGNIVTSLALAKNPDFRKKVALYMACAAPYYGSFVALDILENGAATINSLIDTLEETVSSVSFLSVLAEKISSLRYQCLNDVLPMFQGYPSMTQLLPTIEQICPDGINSSLVYDGNPVRTKEELLAYYRSRDWAYNDKGELRPWIADLDSYWDAFYVDGVHSSKLVNTYYFVGTGVSTTTEAVQSGTRYSSTVSSEGDGTVPVISATLGNPEADNVIFLEGFDHIEAGHAFPKGLGEAFDRGEESLTVINRIKRAITSLFDKK